LRRTFLVQVITPMGQREVDHFYKACSDLPLFWISEYFLPYSIKIFTHISSLLVATR
jgi:hypothetical protein